ncbi:aldehyde dehydrogenase family protein [Sphingorhabdus sp. EL138]|uniref:aldehyde dehydrogenase family protein n=1 Tax=Sphingorhabdus sp. EL138 TaxID=2073156 RepID=UPI0025EB1872|nr:aldehyde dehydrogenase family protein [Sphingorhabdus sp. EL138]
MTLIERHKKAAEILPVAGSLIGGERYTSGAVGNFDHINPATGQAQANIALSGTDAVDAAVAAARAAAPGWRNTSGARRREILEKLAELIIKNGEELATISTLENGATMGFGATRFVSMAAEWTRYYAGWADKLDGLVVDTQRDEAFVYTIPEPFGVVGIIITWNAPLLSLAMKTPPALAAGNTVVLKPAEFTPFTSLRFLDLAKEAGLPDGVLNLVIGGPETGAAISAHAGINKISFTGGPSTATKIMQSAANNLVPVLFELGGKGANLVFDDANLAEAIPYSATFSLVNTGQGCALPTRLLVQRGVYDAVVEGVTAVVSQYITGDPLEMTTFAGPLVNDAALQRVSGIIEKAKAEKAGRLVLGGNRPGGELADGFFVDTTIFADVDPQSSLAQNEVFGPVLSIIPFDTEEEAVEIANSTAYGLSNYVQTSDMRRARRLARDLHSGTVGINGTGNMHVGAPFGGVGISGFGREGGREGVMEFVSTKTVLIG